MIPIEHVWNWFRLLKGLEMLLHLIFFYFELLLTFTLRERALDYILWLELP